MRFDWAIMNPPFSLNYSLDGMPFPERLPYAWVPQSGRRPQGLDPIEKAEEQVRERTTSDASVGSA